MIKDVTDTFKKAVIGETWQESLAKIESEIYEKFLRIKTMFERENLKQMKNTLAKHVAPVESKIRHNQFTSPQDLMEAVSKMKKDFLEELKDVSIKNKELLLSQECERIVFKGMDYIFMTLQNQLQCDKRQFDEKINYLEGQISSMKTEQQED